MSTKKISAPQWLLQRFGITNRQWKAKKRAELKAIISAFEEYRRGCAFCPGYGFNGDIHQLETVLNKLKSSHSVKEWGR